MRILATLFISAFIMAACAAGSRTPQALDPQFTPGEFAKVALAPVVFADTPLDRHLGIEVANRVRSEAQEALREKGYEVQVMEVPLRMQVPTVARDADMVRLAPEVPPGADGVVVIRIDHFFEAQDTDLKDLLTRIPFELHGTAALISPDGTIVWRGEGTGRGSRVHSGFGMLELMEVSAQLVKSLFATLPPGR